MNQCRTCGACCVGDGPEHVGVTPAEAAEVVSALGRWSVSEGQDFRAIATEVRGGRCRCVMLLGEPGKITGCAIYELRPAVCRGVQPGDSYCEYARKAGGIQ